MSDINSIIGKKLKDMPELLSEVINDLDILYIEHNGAGFEVKLSTLLNKEKIERVATDNLLQLQINGLSVSGSTKADKVIGGTVNNISLIATSGNYKDSGISIQNTVTLDNSIIKVSTNNVIKAYADTKQPIDSTLTALSAYNTNGFLTQIGVDTFAGRSINGVSNRIFVTNTGGIAGNPIIDISSSYIGQSSITNVGTLVSGSLASGFSPVSNALLQNSSITINGTNVSLGGSITVSSSTTNALTVGTGLQYNIGTTFDGSVAKTISIDSSIVTLTGVQILTNKSINGSTNTLTNIGDSSLSTSYVKTDGTRQLTGNWNIGAFKIGINNGIVAPITGIHLVEDTTSTIRGLLTEQYSNSTTSAKIFTRKARGTFGTPAPIITGDVLGNWTSSGHDGSNFLDVSDIRAISTGTISTGIIPTQFIIRTTNQSGILSQALLIDKDQSITFSGKAFLHADAITALEAVTLQQLQAAVVGLWDDRGNFTPIGNYPSTGGSGTAGAILKGDIWTIAGLGIGVTGTVGTKTVNDGDTVRAKIDTPGNTDANWAILEGNLGYTPLSNTLLSGQIFVGNASNIATGVTISGDITITNTGVTAIGNLKVTNGMLAGSIAATKLIGTDITTIGNITTGTWNGTTIAINKGGSGQTTANTALNAFLPTQTTFSGKFLQTDGTNTSWVAASGGTVTSVAISGTDFSITGSPITTTGTIGLTLATVNSNIGTFNTLTVNAKGLVTSATNTAYLTTNQTITLTGNVTGSGATTIATTIANNVVTNAMLTGGITDGNLATLYIKADGTRALSGNWLAGAFYASHNGVRIGSAASTIDLDSSGTLIIGSTNSTILNVGNNTSTVNIVGTNAIFAASSSYLTLAAGTTLVSPLKLISGTNLTSPTNGSFEYDGADLYFTKASSIRGTVYVEVPRLYSAISLANNTARTSSAIHDVEVVLTFTFVSTVGQSATASIQVDNSGGGSFTTIGSTGQSNGLTLGIGPLTQIQSITFTVPRTSQYRYVTAGTGGTSVTTHFELIR